MPSVLRTIRDRRLAGDAILSRLSRAPSTLAAAAAQFRAAHLSLSNAEDDVRAARASLGAALARASAASDTLQASFEALADALVGSGLARRNRPFAGLHEHPPSVLLELGYKKRTAAARAIVTRVLAQKPPPAVKLAAAACARDAAALETCVSGLIAPAHDYKKARGARDELIPAWQRRLATLRKHAALAYDGDAGAYARLFAPPSALQNPRRSRSAA